MLLQVDETLGSLFKNDRVPGQSVQANLVVIGPFTEDAKAATGRCGVQKVKIYIVWHDPCGILSVCWFCSYSEPVSWAATSSSEICPWVHFVVYSPAHDRTTRRGDSLLQVWATVRVCQLMYNVYSRCVLGEHIPSKLMDIHAQKSYTMKHTYRKSRNSCCIKFMQF